ncbi:hypothetical protein AAG906_003914 [Vitis piasezkii]
MNVQLSDSMRQAAALLADEDVDESASSSKAVDVSECCCSWQCGEWDLRWFWIRDVGLVGSFGSGGFVSGFWIWYRIEGESLDVLGSVEMVDGCVDLGWGHLKWEFELVEKCWELVLNLQIRFCGNTHLEC